MRVIKQRFIENAEQCLTEAEELSYAYFKPVLDEFSIAVSVEDILFKVLEEVDSLDLGYTSLVAEMSEYSWNGMRNKAWRKKALVFLDKWADEAHGSSYCFKLISE